MPVGVPFPAGPAGIYLCLQPQPEEIKQNGGILRQNREKHSDIWQFRWWEKHPKERRPIDGGKSERAIRFQILKQRVKQPAFLCRASMHE